ncbi:hypothetical protein [Lutibacter flavus]|uniref:2-Component system ADP-ribosyltransferase domain-containing protein n=1 Tax=Lutibacter flavus TaxID=691689 RepID=A0A238VIB6_9FLAO|nr:hypothetical protein [Lutibacter flavus]SNR33931.1 hypothetical protein SAMN04488111_0527 [Lutibacter flavus]
MEKIYLPIASFNLGHYFTKGCICPTRYISNRNEDIQNRFDNSLLFCRTKFTDETNCSLEIVLTQKESKSIKEKTTNFFLLDLVLPISRVKRIFFKDEKQKVKTVANINDGAAFIPDEIVDVDLTNEYSKTDEILAVKNISEKKDWQSKIDLYDKLLGGFAFMRLGGESWMNYSKNYFQTFSLLNKLVKEQLYVTTLNFDNPYEWLILDNNKYESLRSSIYSNVDYKTVEGFAKEEDINLKKRLGIIDLDGIKFKSKTYLIAILATYGSSGRKKIDDFITDLINNKFSEPRKEGISLMFGINSGYKAFRNKYKTSKFEVDVKFKLNSQLDYYTIESIYQYVFNNKTDNYSFFYIDSWCPKSNERVKIKEYQTYTILDKTIIYKKKVQIGSLEYLQELYQSVSPNNLFESITKIVNGWLPDFLKTEKTKEASLYFERNLKTNIEAIVKDTYKKVKADIDNDIKLDKENILLENIELKKSIKKIQNNYDELLITNDNLLGELNSSSPKTFVDNTKEQIEDSTSETFDLHVDRGSRGEGEEKNNIDDSSFQGEMNFPVNLSENKKTPNESEHSQIGLREKELSVMGITKLRNEAKKTGIKATSRFANNPVDKERLVKLIIEKESNS